MKDKNFSPYATFGMGKITSPKPTEKGPKTNIIKFDTGNKGKDKKK